VGFTTGSRAKVPGKTYEKRRRKNNNNNKAFLILTTVIIIIIIMTTKNFFAVLRRQVSPSTFGSEIWSVKHKNIVS
jgi:hypothetical protein